jgi:hypothetical protein
MLFLELNLLKDQCIHEEGSELRLGNALERLDVQVNEAGLMATPVDMQPSVLQKCYSYPNNIETKELKKES